MFARQLRHVFRKEIAQLRRNRDALRILLVAPFLQMIAFGYAATTDIKDIPFVLVDQDRSPASRALIERFTGSGYFRIAGAEDSPPAVDDWLLRGRADLALVIPAGYGRDLARGGRPEVQVLADGTDSNSSMRGMAYAGQIIADEAEARFGDRELPGVGNVVVEPRVWYNPDLRSRWFMVPAVLALVLTVVLLTLSSMAIVRERETGTMEQLIVTPLDPRALILGKLAPYVIVGLLELLVTTTVAVAWFRVPLRGSPVELIGLSLLYVVVALAVGLLVSTLARTQQQAMMASMFFVMTPMIWLSGFLFPIENMPDVIQALTWFLPLRYFAEIVRGVFLKGATLSTLWPNALALLAFAIVLVAVSARRFRKTLD
ncbi:MAG: ABC transporter permease [Candidatus Eiseniibacteriota bacterium]